MNWLFAGLERLERREADKTVFLREPGGQPGLTWPYRGVTDEPNLMVCVLSDEYRTWQDKLPDYTDDPPGYPLRHTYQATPAGWTRLCDLSTYTSLGMRMDPEHFDACPDCEARRGELAGRWMDVHGQWGE
jgi:hypothetical protein